MDVFLLILFVVAVLGAFYGGIVLGISDCKRRFDIPKKALGVNENGYYYS